MLDRIERILVAGNRWLLILLLLAMACIVFANVVLRYTTGDSIVWAEWPATMIWVTFLGAGLVLRFGGHVAIDNLHRAVGTRSADHSRHRRGQPGPVLCRDDRDLVAICLCHALSDHGRHGHPDLLYLRRHARGLC